MIKAVLLDLDDTLIQNDMNLFFPRYMSLLASHLTDIVPSDDFFRHAMDAAQAVIQNENPLTTNHEEFMAHFLPNVGRQADEMEPVFADFYANRFAALREAIRPQSAAAGLLEYLFEHNIQVVVATNPLMPASAVQQRMAWGGVGANLYPYALITALENMHYAKPRPQYFAEILERINLTHDQAIMVGDSWTDDIAAAAAAGLNTYWVAEDGTDPPGDPRHTDGYGTFDEFAASVRDGWLEQLKPHQAGHAPLLQRLEVAPATIDALLREHPRHIIECKPCVEEWSARDVVCHLRDHEIEVDRARLQRILDEDNPFISATFDPWEYAQEYVAQDARQALGVFAERRAETVRLLKALPDEAWERPARHSVFGPTYFGEMVEFMADHDRVHYQQIQDAIAQAYDMQALSQAGGDVR
jgi:FMN phosphatase YigB (HAD superfamily)